MPWEGVGGGDSSSGLTFPCVALSIETPWEGGRSGNH